MKILKLICALIILLLLLGVIAFSVTQRLELVFDPPPAEPEKPVAVEVKTLEKESFERWRTYPGTIDTDRKSTLSSRISGRILEVPHRAGTRVEQGELLVRLDDEELLQEMSKLGSRQQEVQSSLDLARKQLQRREDLYQRDVISREELDESQTRVEGLMASRSELQYSLEAVRTRLEYTRIRSPYEAVVGRVHAQPGDMAQPGKSLLELVGTTGLKVEFVLPQRDTARIETGVRVQVEILDLDQRFDTRLDRLHPSLEAPGRGVPAESLLPDAASGLRPGLEARVKVRDIHAQQALLVPGESVYKASGKSWVFLLEDGVAQRREVLTGAQAQGRVAITRGLNSGDTLIITPRSDLSHGDPVQVEE